MSFYAGVKMRFFLLIFLGFPLFAQQTPGAAQGARDLPQDQDAMIEFCLNGIRESCRALKSGVATFDGSLNTEFTRQPDYNLSGPVEGMVAYDGAKIRFDISRPGWVVDKSEIEGVQNDDARRSAKARMIKGQLTKRFCDDGTKIAIWNSDQPMVTIGQISDLPDRRVTEHIDFRCPTFFDAHSIDRGWTLEYILDRFDTAFADSKASLVKQDGVWEITWTYIADGEATRWVLAVDVENGFVPTRYRCESSTNYGVNDNAEWVREWENVTEWKQIAAVWVPVRSERSLFSGPASQVDEQLVLNLEWGSVNEPVDPELFEYKSFEVPDEVAIQDSSGGGAVWIKHLPSHEASDELQPRQHSLSRITLIVINVALLITLLGYFGWRKLHHIPKGR